MCHIWSWIFVCMLLIYWRLYCSTLYTCIIIVAVLLLLLSIQSRGFLDDLQKWKLVYHYQFELLEELVEFVVKRCIIMALCYTEETHHWRSEVGKNYSSLVSSTIQVLCLTHVHVPSRQERAPNQGLIIDQHQYLQHNHSTTAWNYVQPSSEFL